MDEYASEAMRDGLRALLEWKSSHGGVFVAKWLDGLRARDAVALAVDGARRAVKYYFLKALRLYECGYTSHRFLRETCAVYGLSVLRDVVHPLEKSLDNGYDVAKLEQLLEVCRRHRIGEAEPRMAAAETKAAAEAREEPKAGPRNGG
jgi:hypothetical protein